MEGLNATVEFVDANDAGIVLKAASKSTGGEGIRFHGKSVGALPSRRFDRLESKGSKDIFYDIENEKVLPSRKPVTNQGKQHLCARVILQTIPNYSVMQYTRTHLGQGNK